MKDNETVNGHTNGLLGASVLSPLPIREEGQYGFPGFMDPVVSVSNHQDINFPSLAPTPAIHLATEMAVHQSPLVNDPPLFPATDNVLFPDSYFPSVNTTDLPTALGPSKLQESVLQSNYMYSPAIQYESLASPFQRCYISDPTVSSQLMYPQQQYSSQSQYPPAELNPLSHYPSPMTPFTSMSESKSAAAANNNRMIMFDMTTRGPVQPFFDEAAYYQTQPFDSAHPAVHTNPSLPGVDALNIPLFLN